ncbi:MAG: hypothetical protein Q9M91_02795 [Candidatus Dojkabacteria bacterium]|nr:hypothetical protein [Candidatus Dojkabacteria bacterium]
MIVYDVDNSKFKLDLFNDFNYIPDRIEWLKDSKSLLVEDGNIIYIYDLSNGERELIYYNPKNSGLFSIVDGSLYFLNEDQSDLVLYKNGSKRGLISEYEDLEIPLGVTKIYGKNTRDQVIIFETKDKLNFNNLSEDVYKKINGNFDLVDISLDGNTFIFLDKENNKVYSFVTEHTIDSDIRLRADYFELGDSSDKISYSVSNSGTIIIRVINSEIGSRIDLMDTDGSNVHSIDLKDEIISESVVVEKDNERIFFSTLNENGSSNMFEIRFDK